MTMTKTQLMKIFEDALSKYGRKYGIDRRHAKILTSLAESPKTFKELEAETRIPKPTLGRRLVWLANEGFIKKYDTMRTTLYAPRVIYATDYFGFTNLLRAILNEMETEMERLKIYIQLLNAILDKVEYPIQEQHT